MAVDTSRDAVDRLALRMEGIARQTTVYASLDRAHTGDAAATLRVLLAREEMKKVDLTVRFPQAGKPPRIIAENGSDGYEWSVEETFEKLASEYLHQCLDPFVGLEAPAEHLESVAAMLERLARRARRMSARAKAPAVQDAPGMPQREHGPLARF